MDITFRGDVVTTHNTIVRHEAPAMSVMTTSEHFYAPGSAGATTFRGRHVALLALLVCVPVPLFSLGATVVPLPGLVARAVATFAPFVSPIVGDDQGRVVRQQAVAVEALEIQLRPAERVSAPAPAKVVRTRGAVPKPTRKQALQTERPVEQLYTPTRHTPTASGGLADFPTDDDPRTDAGTGGDAGGSSGTGSSDTGSESGGSGGSGTGGSGGADSGGGGTSSGGSSGSDSGSGGAGTGGGGTSSGGSSASGGSGGTGSGGGSGGSGGGGSSSGGDSGGTGSGGNGNGGSGGSTTEPMTPPTPLTDPGSGGSGGNGSSGGGSTKEKPKDSK